MEGSLYFTFFAALAAVIMAFFMAKAALSRPEGNERMRLMAKAIQEGASAFLKEEGKRIALIAILIAVFISLVFKVKYGLVMLFGALVSEMAGIVGMYISTHTNVRVAESAKKGLFEAFTTAFSGGSVMGLVVAGFSMMGLTAVMMMFKGAFSFSAVYAIRTTGMTHIHGISVVDGVMIVSAYSFGASLIALFDRVGGGIYTKAADMAADLVGKVEEHIPEDDARNPATIADNVGDNVGDVAGLGADILESYIASIISTIALVMFMAIADKNMTSTQYYKLLYLPIAIAGGGIIAAMIGISFVKFRRTKDARAALSAGNILTGVIVLIISAIIVYVFKVDYAFPEKYVIARGTPNMWRPFFSILFGLIAGLIISKFSEYYTSYDYKPVRHLAESSQTGVAINITGGLALGMKSTLWPVLTIVFSMLGAYLASGVYGIGIAALGMLSFVAYTVTVDSYGPIADNAGGIAQMSNLDPKVREITDELDAVGNTTAAIGKGFAIGSAAFAALSLIVSFIWSSAQTTGEISLNPVINMINPYTIIGLITGAMLPFFFSALLIDGVSENAFLMVKEVRRQFKADPKILKGESLPDYNKCISITATGAISKMFLPGVIAIIMPFAVGYLLGKDALAGVLLGGLLSAIMIAIFTANAGGAMDNAKKYVEMGNFGGRGTPTHDATIIGDTVGDPLKDTVGPSMDILIKLMAVLSLFFGSLFSTLPFFVK